MAEADGAWRGRQGDVRVRVVERFPRAKVHNRVGPLRRIRSGLALLLTALILGVLLAGVLSAAVYGLSVAIHHASTS